MKKGQSTLEYLITYGWAILIIVTIAAVLWYFGVFNPSRWAGSSATGFTKFTVQDFALYTDGNFIIVMSSLNDKTIKLYNITATFDESNYTTNLTTFENWAPSQTKTISINMSSAGLNEIGQDYRIDVAISYMLGNLTHIDYGTIIGKVQ